MNPIELLSRRRGLGMSVIALAEALNVAEKSINRWEFGKNQPREWVWIDDALTALEDHQASMIEEMVTRALEIHKETGEAALVTYASRGSYYRWHPEARHKEWPVGATGIPVELHNSAAANAAYQLRTKHGLKATFTAAPEEP